MTDSSKVVYVAKSSGMTLELDAVPSVAVEHLFLQCVRLYILWYN
jgi:hypothetical protein